MNLSAEHNRRGSHIDTVGFSALKARRGSIIEPVRVDSNALFLRDEVVQRASVSNPDYGGLNADAQDATEHETQQTVLGALRLYKKAAFWSVLMSAALVMEGYDFVLLTNFFALDSYNHKFGNEHTSHGPTISAPWRSALTDGALVGEIIGLWATGYLQDLLGYKKTMSGALVLMTCFIFVLFFAQSLAMLLAGEIICGLSWGVFQTITTAYASEVTPVALRAYLTTSVNLLWLIGQLIGSGILRAMQQYGTWEWGWRIPYALQWFWPVPILIGSILAPESPWWLVRHGHCEAARKSLLRLTSPETDPVFDVDKTIAMIEHTTEIEREMCAGTGYLDCFKGSDRRRTEIACMTWLVQVLCGSTLVGYSSVFYTQAGLSSTSAYDLSVGQYGLGACGVFLNWYLMGRFGRRTLYLGGVVVLFGFLLIIGFLAIGTGTRVQWALGSMLLVFTFVYNSTVGPVCYSLVSELPSTRLKAKTIVLARSLFNVGGLVANVITNYQLTSTAWNWKGYSGFFWAGTCFLSIVWIYFRLPEPKGRTYGELDLLFEHKVPARDFKKTNVSIFRGETIQALPGESLPALDNVEREKLDTFQLQIQNKEYGIEAKHY